MSAGMEMEVIVARHVVPCLCDRLSVSHVPRAQLTNMSAGQLMSIT